MGTQSVQMKGKGSFLGWFIWLSCRYKRLLSFLGCSGQLSTKYFFPTGHYFNLCVPIAQQAGQAVVQGRLSLNECLRLYPYRPNTVCHLPIKYFYVILKYKLNKELADTMDFKAPFQKLIIFVEAIEKRCIFIISKTVIAYVRGSRSPQNKKSILTPFSKMF
jgi:hypothetical protein